MVSKSGKQRAYIQLNDATNMDNIELKLFDVLGNEVARVNDATGGVMEDKNEPIAKRLLHL